METLLIPALALIETDRHKGALAPESERFAFDATRQILEEIQREEAPAGQPSCSGVCIVPGAQRFSSQTLERVGEQPCRVVCISAVPPHAASHAACLARRLKKRLPGLKVVVALWTSEGIDKIRPRLVGAGVDEVFTRVADVAAHLRQPA